MPISRDNNFNVLRLIAASSVIISHAYAAQNPSIEFLVVSPALFGWCAVNVFFSMSGFLIMSALDRSGDVTRYFRNRILRIYPGLIVCTIITVLILSLFSPANFSSYISSPETLNYLFRNSTLIGIGHTLPGVFQHLPLAGAVNGSLWTLRFEMYCYITVGVSFAVGALKQGRIRWIAFGAAFATYTIVFAIRLRHGDGSDGIDRFQRLGFCFLLGMVYASAFNGFRLKFWHVAVVTVIALLLAGTPLRQFSMSVALAAIAFWLAYLDIPWIKGMQKGPDYSYGIYIYAFPIQQALLALGIIVHPVLETVAVLALTLPVAAMSWHFVESPALRLKQARFWKKLPIASAPTE